MQTKFFTYGEGIYALEAELALTGNGFTLTLCSKEYGHVGAVAVAAPSSEASDLVSCTLLPGHRDDIPAKDLALKLAAQTKVPAVVSVGMHIENASKEDIQTLMNNAEVLGRQIIEYAQMLCAKC